MSRICFVLVFKQHSTITVTETLSTYNLLLIEINVVEYIKKIHTQNLGVHTLIRSNLRHFRHIQIQKRNKLSVKGKS